MKSEEEQLKESASKAGEGFLGKAAFDLAVLTEGILTGRQAGQVQEPSWGGELCPGESVQGSLSQLLSPSSSQKMDCLSQGQLGEQRARAGPLSLAE